MLCNLNDITFVKVTMRSLPYQSSEPEGRIEVNITKRDNSVMSSIIGLIAGNIIIFLVLYLLCVFL
jgi:hypothetical protein